MTGRHAWILALGLWAAPALAQDGEDMPEAEQAEGDSSGKPAKPARKAPDDAKARPDAKKGDGAAADAEGKKQVKPRDPMLRAIDLPVAADAARKAGIPEAQVAKAVEASKKAKLEAGEAADVLRRGVRAARGDGSFSRFGDVVQDKLASGLRGRELGQAIAEARRAGKGGKGKGAQGEGKGKGPDGKGPKMDGKGPHGPGKGAQGGKGAKGGDPDGRTGGSGKGKKGKKGKGAGPGKGAGGQGKGGKTGGAGGKE